MDNSSRRGRFEREPKDHNRTKSEPRFDMLRTLARDKGHKHAQLFPPEGLNNQTIEGSPQKLTTKEILPSVNSSTTHQPIDNSNSSSTQPKDKGKGKNRENLAETNPIADQLLTQQTRTSEDIFQELHNHVPPFCTLQILDSSSTNFKTLPEYQEQLTKLLIPSKPLHTLNKEEKEFWCHYAILLAATEQTEDCTAKELENTFQQTPIDIVIINLETAIRNLEKRVNIISSQYFGETSPTNFRDNTSTLDLPMNQQRTFETTLDIDIPPPGAHPDITNTEIIFGSNASSEKYLTIIKKVQEDNPSDFRRHLESLRQKLTDWKRIINQDTLATILDAQENLITHYLSLGAFAEMTCYSEKRGNCTLPYIQEYYKQQTVGTLIEDLNEVERLKNLNIKIDIVTYQPAQLLSRLRALMTLTQAKEDITLHQLNHIAMYTSIDDALKNLDQEAKNPYFQMLKVTQLHPSESILTLLQKFDCTSLQTAMEKTLKSHEYFAVLKAYLTYNKPQLKDPGEISLYFANTALKEGSIKNIIEALKHVNDKNHLQYTKWIIMYKNTIPIDFHEEPIYKSMMFLTYDYLISLQNTEISTKDKDKLLFYRLITGSKPNTSISEIVRQFQILDYQKAFDNLGQLTRKDTYYSLEEIAKRQEKFQKTISYIRSEVGAKENESLTTILTHYKDKIDEENSIDAEYVGQTISENLPLIPKSVAQKYKALQRDSAKELIDLFLKPIQGQTKRDNTAITQGTTSSNNISTLQSEIPITTPHSWESGTGHYVMQLEFLNRSTPQQILALLKNNGLIISNDEETKLEKEIQKQYTSNQEYQALVRTLLRDKNDPKFVNTFINYFKERHPLSKFNQQKSTYSQIFSSLRELVKIIDSSEGKKIKAIQDKCTKERVEEKWKKWKQEDMARKHKFINILLDTLKLTEQETTELLEETYQLAQKNTEAVFYLMSNIDQIPTTNKDPKNLIETFITKTNKSLERYHNSPILSEKEATSIKKDTNALHENIIAITSLETLHLTPWRNETLTKDNTYLTEFRIDPDILDKARRITESLTDIFSINDLQQQVLQEDIASRLLDSDFSNHPHFSVMAEYLLKTQNPKVKEYFIDLYDAYAESNAQKLKTLANKSSLKKCLHILWNPSSHQDLNLKRYLEIQKYEEEKIGSYKEDQKRSLVETITSFNKIRNTTNYTSKMRKSLFKQLFSNIEEKQVDIIKDIAEEKSYILLKDIRPFLLKTINDFAQQPLLTQAIQLTVLVLTAYTVYLQYAQLHTQPSTPSPK